MICVQGTTAATNQSHMDVDGVQLAELIDRHLSHIYPVYWARTRAILVRQARELVALQYDGSLPRFEQRYLCKFAQIAATLRATHQIGEVSAPNAARCPTIAPTPENPEEEIAAHRSII